MTNLYFSWFEYPAQTRRVQPPSRAGLVPSRTLRAPVTTVFALPLSQRGDQVTNGNVKPTSAFLKQRA